MRTGRNGVDSGVEKETKPHIDASKRGVELNTELEQGEAGLRTVHKRDLLERRETFTEPSSLGAFEISGHAMPSSSRFRFSSLFLRPSFHRPCKNVLRNVSRRQGEVGGLIPFYRVAS